MDWLTLLRHFRRSLLLSHYLVCFLCWFDLSNLLRNLFIWWTRNLLSLCFVIYIDSLWFDLCRLLNLRFWQSLAISLFLCLSYLLISYILRINNRLSFRSNSFGVTISHLLLINWFLILLSSLCFNSSSVLMNIIIWLDSFIGRRLLIFILVSETHM